MLTFSIRVNPGRTLNRNCLTGLKTCVFLVKGAGVQAASVLFFLLISLSNSAFAERYSVEKDSFGNYSAKKVESLSVEKTEVDHDQHDEKVEVITTPSTSETKEQLEDQAASTEQAASSEHVSSSEKEPVLSGTTPSEIKPDNDDAEPRKLSIFEQKYIEAELAERKRILNELKASSATGSDYDATEVNPDEFIDSESLLRSGAHAEKERSPYYVTVDADGTQRTVFYDPEQIKEILFHERNQKIEFTEAEIFMKPESELVLPPTADPKAISILSGGKGTFISQFETFAEKCCAQLPNIETPAISLGNYHYFVLNDDSLPYRFAEGDSRFLLLSLPDINQAEFPLRIRTFIRRFSKQNIDKGVFFPQLITLDKDKKPLRMFSGPLLKFQDETWTKHAYLQGIFPLSQTRELDERYLLINTTRELLASSSTIEIPASEDGPAKTVVLKHMNEGSFEVEILQ